jgi:UDP-N-acetylglucosamine 2-epimerase (non-hydrolysing)
VKVLSVVGARPQFVKLAPVAEAFADADVEHVIVHTGQHYDAAMSDVFFADLKIPDPDVNLGIGSGSHGVQTGAMLAALDGVLDEHRPDWVLVYGDTNSTLAGALSAAKMHLKVAHLEAGLRSFNRRMPEEINRVVTDHTADLLLAPTTTAMDHLESEGLVDRSVLVGDVMADICLRVANTVEAEPLMLEGEEYLDQGYYLGTIHRAENTDDPTRLRQIVTALASLDQPVLLLAHPRLAMRAKEYGLHLNQGSLRSFAPVPYPSMVRLVQGARRVVTDSGGLQKEAYLIGTPCVTVRTETEWVETLHGGWNTLCPDPVSLPELVTAPIRSPRRDVYGGGSAAIRVLKALSCP